MPRFCHVLAAGLLITALGAGSSAAAAASKPASAKAKAFDAAAFFSANCAGCHGPKGQGGFGPNLQKAETKPDVALRDRILEGSPKGMPPFASKLSADELKALLAYVKRL